MHNEEGKIVIQPVGEQVLRYIKLRKEYKNYATDQKQVFIQRYKSSIFGFDDLIVKIDSIVEELKSMALEKALLDIVNLGFYDIGKEAFRSKYFFRYDTWRKDFQSIRDQYDEITLSAAEVARKRNDASSESSGIIGGGFGVEGAAKGIAIATAANLAISAVQGVANSVGSAAEAAKTRKDKDMYFRNTELLSQLILSIEKLVFSVHFAIVDLANSSNDESIYFGIPTDEEIDRASAIFENVVSGRINKEKSLHFILQAISLNPYSEEIYKYWLAEYGDEGNEVTKISESYGMGSLKGYKNELLDVALSKLNLSTPQSCEQARLEFVKYGNFLAVENVDAWLLKIQTPAELEKERINLIVDAATKNLAEQGLKLAVPPFPSLIIHENVEAVVEGTINDAVNVRMKSNNDKLVVQILFIIGLLSFFVAWPIGVFFVIWAIIYQNLKFNAHKKDILAEGQTRLIQEGYAKGTPHANYPNVVWNGHGQLDPADGYDWVSLDSGYAVKPAEISKDSAELTS